MGSETCQCCIVAQEEIEEMARDVRASCKMEERSMEGLRCEI